MIDSSLRLMLIDEDPVFRLGLRIWLEQSAGYRVVAEANQSQDALAILASRSAQGDASRWSEMDGEPAIPPTPGSSGSLDIDLVVLDLGLGTGNATQLPGLQLCREIKTRFPALPVLVLSAQVEPVLEAAARQMGANGFGPRSMPVADLGQLIEQLSRPSANPMQGSRPTSPLRPQPPRAANVVAGERDPQRSQPLPYRLGPWTTLRLGLRQSSVQQIEAAMAAIEAEQRRGRADVWTEAILAGRYRELKAARWLMGKLLATPELDGWGSLNRPSRPSSDPIREARSAAELARTVAPPPIPPLGSASRGSKPGPGPALMVEEADQRVLPHGDLATLLFERVFNQLQGCLDNTSGLPLETDILRDDKKRELFYLTLRKVEDALDHLRQAGILPGQLAEQSPLVLRDIWEATLTDFFGRYYTVQLTNLEQPVVPTLMAEAEIVQRSILDRIPQVSMLLGHLLFNESIVVDGCTYVANSPQALERSQALLENLLIQVANGTIQPLLNCFADVELMKKNLYQRRMITSRDIERFRNDLSWRYRWDGLINEPKAIFESQHRLWVLTERGLQTQAIYAPRRAELDQLSGLQRVVTLTIEARDAVAPRFRSAVSLVGSGIVYVLTDVIGRGIGLIGRGILRGVGSAWRDPRYRESSYRRDRPPNDVMDE